MSESQGFSRRNFLQSVGGVVLGVCVVPVLEGCEIHTTKPIGGGEKGTILPLLTPTSDWYEQHGARPYLGAKWAMPDIKKEDWKLTLKGQGFDKTITYAELEKKVQDEGVTFLKTLRCVFDVFDVPGLMSSGIWRGVPLRTFLPTKEELEQKGVKWLRFFGADGFQSSLKFDRIYGTRPDDLLDVMLVTQLNGEPLPRRVGFPVRLLVHEAYGYKNMKWLDSIEFSTEDKAFGHYEGSNYNEVGELQVVSKVTKPLTGSVVVEGKVKVIGMAFSGGSGIEKVEIAEGTGEFKPAKLSTLDELKQEAGALASLLESTVQVKENKQYPFRAAWVRWEYEFDAKPGNVELRIRAVDRAGNVQPDKDTEPFNGNTPVTVLKFIVAEKKAT